jgi:hypothetical protein
MVFWAAVFDGVEFGPASSQAIPRRPIISIINVLPRNN